MRARRLAGCIGLFSLLGAGWLFASRAMESASSLPRIALAPDFALVTQDDQPLALRQLRGKVVVVSFIYTSCPDECPLLTAELAALQPRLGRDFGSRIIFVSITLDPDHDTPDVLRAYARGFRADGAGWAFLRGGANETQSLARRYGLFVYPAAGGRVEHGLLTSIVDQTGMLRVQYIGTAFDPDEMLADLRSLLREGLTL